MGKFIVLEGIDGTGKSTVAQLLCGLMNNNGHPTIYLSSVLEGYLGSAKYVNENCDVDAHYLFYLSAVKHCSDYISKRLSDKNIICDRYIYSTLAYHKARNTGISIDLKSLNLTEPNFVFLLTISDETVRRNRIDLRKNNTIGDEEIKTKNSLLYRVESNYKVYNNLISIDATYKSAEGVSKEIFDIIFKG